MSGFTSTMNYDEFIKQHQDRIIKLYKQKVLEHPESGKISCYIISKGDMYSEQQLTNESIFTESVFEVAAELSVKLELTIDKEEQEVDVISN